MSSNGESQLRVCAVTILSIAALILSGCEKPRPGPPIEPSREDLSHIKTVGLCVKVERGFAVRLMYLSNADQVFLGNLISQGLGGAYGGSRGVWRPGGVVGGGTSGAAMGGALGAAAAVVGELSPDKQDTGKMKPVAAPMDSQEAIGRAVLDALTTAQVFPEIKFVPSEPPTVAGDSGADTRLLFTVRRWGLCRPLGSNYETGDKSLAQLELDVNLKLLSSSGGKVLWERDEFYMDSQCHSVGDFKSQEGLLVSRMRTALRLVCDWTANGLRRMHQS